MSTRTFGGDVVVIGAGLIGLGIALELAERGATVRLFERGEPARAASWAGAGMLAPHTEQVEDEALLALCTRSLALYPHYVERLRDLSSVDAHLRLTGILNTAFDAAEFARLTGHADALRQRGVAVEVLDRAQTRDREPALGSGVVGGVLVCGEGYIDNRRLGRALTAACIARGVTLVRDVRELSIESDARRVLGVRSDRGFTAAQTVIVAAGAWAADVPGLPEACRPPVEPVKGQMLALATPRRFVRGTTWVPGAYLVPRDDGRLLIGATVEYAGFDERVTADAMLTLLHAALSAMPSLGDFTMTESWAGLRPGTPDGRPFLGPTAIDGLVLATGHYRNGILLTPVTAALVADVVEHRTTPEIEPFLLARRTEAVQGARISGS